MKNNHQSNIFKQPYHIDALSNYCLNAERGSFLGVCPFPIFYIAKVPQYSVRLG